MSDATIIDVAKRAGTSKSLVSLVLRGSAKVSEAKRRAVLEAAAELDYRPNAAARSLAQRRTNTIGVMLSDLHNMFFAEVLDGIDGRAREQGFRSLINTGYRAPGREAEAIEALLELRTEGLILAGPRLSAAKIMEASRAVPIVLVSRASRAERVDCVLGDDHAGAALAVEHLIALGHRRIAHVDGGRGAGAAGRRRGYERTMRLHGLGEWIRVATGDFTEEGGERGVAALLASGPRPSAIFAANDLTAVGVREALEANGLDVPGDVSLVGYDNTSLAGLRHIDLTTVDQPRLEMGRTAVDLLFERLAGRREGRRVVMAPTLVVRGSTAAPALAGGG